MPWRQIVILLACCVLLATVSTSNQPLKPTVEVENTIYHCTNANNGAGPLWCYGSTCIARCGDELFASGMETLEGMKPLNNLRWVMYKYQKDGWKAVQTDTAGLQREPCPIGSFSNGKLLLSTNPTLNAQGTEGGGPANPHILDFACAHPEKPGRPLQPEWTGEYRFSEHSYRGLGVDGSKREMVLINISREQEYWSFLDKTGKWSNHGVIYYPIRGCYPCVAMKNRACHIFVIGDVVEPVEQWKKWKFEKYGSAWDYVFRRLFYTFNPDVASTQFLRPIEIDNVDSTAGYLGNRDVWIDGQGAAHLLYSKSTVATGDLRDKFFPDTPLVTSLEYCVVRDNKITNRKTLVSATYGTAAETPGWARFQATQDGRLFVIYYSSGTDAQGKSFNENRVMEIGPNGECSQPVTIPLKSPFTNFMTASERAGSPPSRTLDILGSGGDPYEIRYARVRLY